MTDAMSFLDGAAPEPAAPVKLGRPYGTTTYNKADAQIILNGIASGKTIGKICKRKKGRWKDKGRKPPSRSTVYQWLVEQPEFAQAYAMALRFRAEMNMDDMRDIADDSAKDYKKVVDKEGIETMVFDVEHIQRVDRRLKVRQYEMEKRLSHKYGKVAKEIHQNPTPGFDDVGPPRDDIKQIEDGGCNGEDPMRNHPLYEQLKAWETPFVKSNE